MFERRLRVLLILAAVPFFIIVGRLVQLQIVRGAEYRLAASRALMLRPKPIPFVRGSVLDRMGEVLSRDEPRWDLTIDYSAIAADAYQKPSVAARGIKQRWGKRRYPHATTDAEIVADFRAELSKMWTEIARFTDLFEPVSVDALRDRAVAIHYRVQRIRRAVAQRRGFDAPVAEETVAHPIVRGLEADQQVAAHDLFDRDPSRYPWLHVEPSTVRRYSGDSVPFAHLLGRTGQVDATHVENDPNADDPFARYRANERLGITGVEFAAEQTLRGRRGQLTKDRSGEVVAEDSFSAENGRDVTLTVHAELQRRLYRLLGETVDGVPESSGGSIVVLHVPSREVLALVSYPSYDPNRFDELYAELRDDTVRLPLRFRAVANQYAPGSTVKPLTCLSGLMNGRITPQKTERCTGYLLPDVRDKWRCWPIHGTARRMVHGDVNVVEALTGSCNVFMYRLGENLGVGGLCSAFDMVGIGRYSGIGLREEVKGINPTASWLMAHKNIRASSGMARLFAIGQGEVSMTPVQVANLMATLASGRYRPVTLILTESRTPEWAIPATDEQWAAIRRGVYGVVNDPGGTAYKYARFEHDRYVLCGKTGSATAQRWPTSYRIPFVDENGIESVAVIPAGAKGNAIKRFMVDHPRTVFERAEVEVESRWPPQPPPAQNRYSHAWFAGYLQEIDSTRRPDWSRKPRIAFAALVEFGGSGGRTAGPLAKQVSAVLVEVLGPDLNVDTYRTASLLP